MIRTLMTLIFTCLLLFLTGCNSNETFFKTVIENNPGELKILNESSFIGVSSVGTIKDHELILYAAGGLDLTQITASLSSSEPFSIGGGTCSAGIKSGDKCKIIIRYAPTNIAAHTVDIHLSYSDKLRTRNLKYTLTADSRPVLIFEYGMLYDFGNKFLGSSTDLKIKISNRGVVSADNISINNMSLPFSFKGGAYPGSGGDCGTQLIPGESCSIVVNYAPTLNGQHLQDITLSYFKSGESETSTLNLVAWGFRPAVLTLTDINNFDWSIRTNGDDHLATFTLTHSSGDVSANTLTLTTLNSPFSVVGGTCGTSLSKLTGSCTYIVKLNSSISGSWEEPFRLTYHNGKETVTILKTLKGITKQRAVLSFSPSPTVDYGVVAKNSSLTKEITVTYLSGELPATGIAFEKFNSSTEFKPDGGTCSGISLSSGSCTLKAIYSPANYESVTSTTTISYQAGNLKKESEVLTFKAATESHLSFSYYFYNYNFGNVVVGQTKEIPMVIVTHLGGTPISSFTALSLTSDFRFKGGTTNQSVSNFPGSGSTCLTLPILGSCSLQLAFVPETEGAKTGDLTLQYFDGIQLKTKVITLLGTGTSRADVSIENKDFGTGSINGPLSALVKVTNNSSSKEATSLNYTLPSGVYYKGGVFPGTGGSCSLTSLTTTCNLDLVFTPSASTLENRILSLSYNDGVSTKTATSTLSGTGFQSNDLFISNFETLKMDYTYTGHPRTVNLTLSHGGGPTAASISSIGMDISSDYSVTHNCPASLVNGASCTLAVKFDPLTSGTKVANLLVNYHNGSSKTASRAITGPAYLSMLITPTPTSYNFGDQPIGDTFDTTITFKRNAKTVSSYYSISHSMTGTGFTFKGGSFPGTGGTCAPNFGTSTFSGEQCTVVVSFNPILAGGNYTGVLKLRYYDDYTYVYTENVILTGIGKAVGNLTFSPSSYNFGKIIQTTTATKTITISSSGTLPVTSITSLALNAPFSYYGGTYPGTGGNCSQTLASGSSCTVVIAYNPTDVSVKNELLTLRYNNGTYTRQVSATILGESITQAIISVSDGTPYAFGTVNVGGSIDKLFTLTNSGGSEGKNLGGSFSNAVFTFKGGQFPGTGGTCGSGLSSGGNCSIVLSFTPTSAQNYDGNFSLRYHDGLRDQTELKELQGVGSTSLAYTYYLSKIYPNSFYPSELPDHDFEPLFDSYDFERMEKISIGDINQNQSNDLMYITQRRMIKSKDLFVVMDEHSKKILYRIPDLLDVDLHQGKSLLFLSPKKLLIGIYRLINQEYHLVGYEIIDTRSGRTLEKYLH